MVDEGNNQQREEDIENYLRDAGRRGSYAPKTECAGYYCYDEKE